jgi:hypothetical protein
MNYNSILLDEKRLVPLMRHLEHLTKLGEVRATRCVATLVDGTLGHANRDDDDDAVYIPMHMGYRSCYNRYMASLGYCVWTDAVGALTVNRLKGENDENEPVDSKEFVSYPTYYYKWKRSFPNLKVSKPEEDICAYCYAFANRHKYLANQAIGRNSDDDGDCISVDDDVSDGDKSDGDMSDGGDNTITGPTSPRHGDNIDTPESAGRQDDEERELMLLEAAEHIKMARAQRSLYQEKVQLAVDAAIAGKNHSEMV